MSYINIEIPSQSDPGKRYTVSIDLADIEGEAVCSCPAFEFHPEKYCKHIEKVREELRYLPAPTESIDL